MASPRSEPSPTPADTEFDYGGTPIVDSSYGQMIITLVDNGTSLPTPIVTFNPVGHFTERFMEHYLTHFAQEIQRAQSRVRFEQTHGKKKEAA